ncbi:MAG: hypothetical protein ACPL06_01365 [Candidatus Anstonellales archaeon]
MERLTCIHFLTQKKSKQGYALHATTSSLLRKDARVATTAVGAPAMAEFI